MIWVGGLSRQIVGINISPGSIWRKLQQLEYVEGMAKSQFLKITQKGCKSQGSTEIRQGEKLSHTVIATLGETIKGGNDENRPRERVQGLACIVWCGSNSRSSVVFKKYIHRPPCFNVYMASS